MAIIPNNNATPESVWAILQANAEQMAVMRQEQALRTAELDRKIAETDRKIAENDRVIAENAQRQAQTERMLRDNAVKADLRLKQLEEESKKALRGIGNIRNSIGALVEHLMTPDLRAKFNLLGYTFTRFSRNIIINDKEKNMLAEADMMLENSGYVLLIEVKTNLMGEHICAHIKRMDMFRRHADVHGDSRKYLGAIASPSIDDPILPMIYDAGFYPITASEDSVEVHSPQGFKPKEW